MHANSDDGRLLNSTGPCRWRDPYPRVDTAADAKPVGEVEAVYGVNAVKHANIVEDLREIYRSIYPVQLEVAAQEGATIAAAVAPVAAR